MAIQKANQEVGGSVIEMAEAEYMVRATGYINELDDLRHIPLTVNEQGTPVLLKDVAEIRLGPEMRRGIAELDGEGEVVGGIVVMRYGENALKTIAFPCISTGVYSFPKLHASKIAVRTVRECLRTYQDIEEVIFVCFTVVDLQMYVEQLKKQR